MKKSEIAAKLGIAESDVVIDVVQEHHADVFAAAMKKQFKHDPASDFDRCLSCLPKICWQNQMTDKFWLIWQVAVKEYAK